MMRYLSVCSGIEAATVAWHPLGWEPVAFAEIDKFPSAVLAHHYQHVPNLGDFTTIEAADVGPIDLLVGGTPCQSFSVAGLRGGLADDRGNLALEFLRLADRTRPRWLVWENVPGVLSSNGGRDFGSILGGLVELGYGFAYRVLDAQYAGVPQRRRRVFLVGHLGDWRRAATVLFERHSLQGHSPPRRKAGQGVAGTVDASSGGSDENDAADGRLISCDCADTQSVGANQTTGFIGDVVARCVTAGHGKRYDGESETFVAHALRDDGFDASEDGTGRVPPAISFYAKGDGMPTTNGTPTLSTGGGGGMGGAVSIATHTSVRRLTPRECERLQGFPDDYSLIPYRGKPAADGPRYKALGNSMAVPVMAWIGERIELVDGHLRQVA